MAVLPAIIQEEMVDGDPRELFAIIRVPSGRLLCSAKVRIRCE
jgi:hypothetical protein